MNEADRELLREFWCEVRADPANLARLALLIGVVVVTVAAVLTGTALLVLELV